MLMGSGCGGTQHFHGTLCAGVQGFIGGAIPTLCLQYELSANLVVESTTCIPGNASGGDEDTWTLTSGSCVGTAHVMGLESDCMTVKVPGHPLSGCMPAGVAARIICLLQSPMQRYRYGFVQPMPRICCRPHVHSLD